MQPNSSTQPEKSAEIRSLPSGEHLPSVTEASPSLRAAERPTPVVESGITSSSLPASIEAQDSTTTPIAHAAEVSNQITTPKTAADQELIEKEWVEQADHIRDEFGADPRREVAAEHALNKDYLLKRFNFRIDDPKD